MAQNIWELLVIIRIETNELKPKYIFHAHRKSADQNKSNGMQITVRIFFLGILTTY